MFKTYSYLTGPLGLSEREVSALVFSFLVWVRMLLDHSCGWVGLVMRFEREWKRGGMDLYNFSPPLSPRLSPRLL